MNQTQSQEATAENEAAPALKEIFNAERLAHIARETAAVHAGFDEARFLDSFHHDLDSLSLMGRLRRVTRSLHEGLPKDYAQTLSILQALAPRLNSRFVTLILPDYVAQYGLEHFDRSMQALKFFTPFGSSEFAVRPFLRQDLKRALGFMEQWARDPDEHVRRLASEGCRPRLPWSFRLDALVADPSPAWPILDVLNADSSLYVRKSVANHLNDITKDHPDWVLERLERWDLSDARTAWIARHALRTLIKRGDRRALAVIGVGAKAEVKVSSLTVEPARIRLGDRLAFSFDIESTSATPQKLVVDYAIHYVKRSGGSAPKVFKLKEFELGPGASVRLARGQHIKDFTTRTHHAGRHAIDILVNGECLAQGEFELLK